MEISLVAGKEVFLFFGKVRIQAEIRSAVPATSLEFPA
ncbi:hypothetical protein CFter6_0120 [Collimonas fungivorans]|uniref:Uncharacterized protein n=1 Tax=Collimonas fungivorans TaxID=158899 RepID=A0A127P5Z4_9BURK|nr:hypothetical protein CFter6_0120 [Collimonas fungivorans]